MQATITKVKRFYVAHFERHIHAPVEAVWSMLTENEKLQKWFPELSIDELKKGGHILFDFQNGTYEKFKILDLQPNSALEFTWGEDVVRFEIFPETDGCTLVMNEKIKRINNHTPRDLAGWHVCIEAIKSLVEGTEMDSREEMWKTAAGNYARGLAEVQ